MECKNFEDLEKFVMNLNEQEIAEISEHYQKEWDFEVNSSKEILDFLKDADYDFECAKEDKISIEEFVFFWK